MDSPNRPRRVTLELDDDTDAIHGTLEHADGTRERFWGWLELMSALDPATTDVGRGGLPGLDTR
jgi:hypothetical protein